MLGAVIPVGTIPSSDLNNIATTCIVSFVPNQNIQHAPATIGTVVTTVQDANTATQVFYYFDSSAAGKAVWWRTKYGGTWKDWARLDPFGYNTLPDLASALSGVSTSVEKNGGTITVNTGIFAVGHPAFGYCVVSVSEQNNTGVFVEVGGATLSSLDVALARTGFHTFTITNNNTSATIIVKPIMWIHES